MNISENDSVATCEVKRYIGGTTVDAYTETILRYLLVGYILILFPFATCLNGFLVFLIATVKSLHQTAYFLTLQVVVIDLLLTVIATPVSTVGALAGKWTMGPEFCSISLFFLHILRHSRYWMMFVFVTDRFCSIFFPFSHRRHQQKIAIGLSLVAWSVSFFFAVLPLILDCEGFSRVTFYCTGGDGCTNRYYCQSSRIVTTLITNIVGSLLPLIMYICLFVKAKKMQKMIRRMSTTSKSEEDTKNNRKRDWRVNVTFFWLFLALFGINLVPFLLFVFGMSLISGIGLQIPSEYAISTIIFRSLYNILPLVDAISIMRNADIQQAIKFITKSKKSNTSLSFNGTNLTFKQTEVQLATSVIDSQ